MSIECIYIHAHAKLTCTRCSPLKCSNP